MANHQREAYCTLLMNDGYLPGAMVLAHSLRDAGTRKPLVVLATMDSLSPATVEELKTVYDQVIPVDRITNRSPANLYLMNRPDLIGTFTKIALWRQTQFTRVVYIDADVVALRAPDELFTIEAPFAAVTDIGWPDCFNTGVMVLTPYMGDYYALLALAQRGISFDGADQGLLNMHFRNWERLSFAYNCTPSAHYQYVPAYRHFQSSINMVHFIGSDKPWTVGREGRGAAGVYDELLGRWWSVYERHYRATTTAYISGQTQSTTRTVQQHVTGEAQTSDYGFSTFSPPSQAPIDSARVFAPPRQVHFALEPAAANDELPLLEKTETPPAESIQKGETAPVSTVEQRRFSAPQVEWNPAREPPPSQSKPEAAHLPAHQYSMSQDRTLFQAPKNYPEPPKDMWYQVPPAAIVTERPKQIFPWEATQTKATRVFADDPPFSPEPAPSMAETDTTSTAVGDSPATPTTPNFQAGAPTEPFSSYSRTNAWDEVPEIGRYVNAFQRARRGKGQNIPTDGSSEIPGKERRPSFLLTDFPTEVERPSLPVTPAPVRGVTIWGEDPVSSANLPSAEGVPKQIDWDPLAKLEELQRRQSEVLAQPGSGEASRSLPIRNLPGSAPLLPTSEETEVPQTSVSGVSKSELEQKDGPSFQPVDFETTPKGGEDEGVFSPTET